MPQHLRVMLVALAACATAMCSQPAAPPAAEQPATPAVDPNGDRVYITNERSGDMTVIDVATRQTVATIPLGKRPRGIRLSPDGTTLYIALSGSPIAGPGVDESTLPPPDKSADGIGVFDIASQKLLRVIKGVSDPEQMAVSADGTRLFVSLEDTAQAGVINVADGAVLATIPVGGEPEGVDLRPDGQVVYVTSEEDSEIFAIDTTTNKLVTKFKVGPRPRSTGFLPDSSRAYIGSENGSSVDVVDAKTHKVLSTIKLTGELIRPMGIIASPDGKFVFVSAGRGKQIVIIDTATNQEVGRVEVGDRPWGIAVSPDGRTLVSANGPSNDVTFVDVEGRKVIGKVTAGDSPWGVAYVPGRR